jgi:hypothetical protein
LPIATTQSPIRIWYELPHVTAGLDLQEGKIGLGIGADDLVGERAILVRDDFDLVGTRDDVIVGHDVAGWIDDETGPQ